MTSLKEFCCIAALAITQEQEDYPKSLKGDWTFLLPFGKKSIQVQSVSSMCKKVYGMEEGRGTNFTLSNGFWLLAGRHLNATINRADCHLIHAKVAASNVTTES